MADHKACLTGRKTGRTFRVFRSSNSEHSESVYFLDTRSHVSKMSKFGVLVMGPAGAGKVCAFSCPSRQTASDECIRPLFALP